MHNGGFNGFVKVASCIPHVFVGNVEKNTTEIIGIINDADADVLVFPELCVTGCTCGDLLRQSFVLKQASSAVEKIAAATENTGKFVVIGAPLLNDGRLYDCAVVISNGEILGAVPKTFVSNREHYMFASASDVISEEIIIGNMAVPFGTGLLFKEEEKNICLGVEVGDDVCGIVSPSLKYAAAGADIIVNTASSTALVSHLKRRRELVSVQSARCCAAYVYASCAPSESTNDYVMSGHALICEEGSVITESCFKEGVYFGLIDVEKIQTHRLRHAGLYSSADYIMEKDFFNVNFSLDVKNRWPESVNAYPFVPVNHEERFARCAEILNIQSEGLAQRMKKTGIKKVVIGISGGLDSTLALIVVYEAFKKTGLPFENILAFTMPGFGTSSRTLNNSLSLMEKLGTTLKTIDIKDACMQHFSDIGHDPAVYDVTYENVQARERTQILMDIANKEGALVVGTGDLSELALGWCTYNGDHMSMYGLNSSVPKTLVKYIVDAYADMNMQVHDVLKDICDTPISPELLPTDAKGNIAQKTESAIGKYDIHDFILYNFVRNGYSKEKITALAEIAFKGIVASEEIEKTADTFFKRFYSQQFKRNCQPDGPKVGTVSLSARCDWTMPSDADFPW